MGGQTYSDSAHITGITATQRDAMIESVASQSHEDWRTAWYDKNGNVPRIKTTKDQTWIFTHGVTELDIAATTYANLPSDWQGENKLGAEIAVDLVIEAVKENQAKLETHEFMEGASSTVHDRWVDRNRSWAGANLCVPFSELSPDEQEKDRLFVRRAIEAFSRV